MKRIIVSVVGIALTISTFMFNQARADAVCESTQMLAHSVMSMRQDNAPRELVESVINSDVGLSIVDLAYKKAVVNSKDAKRLVVRNFSHSLYLDCQRVRNQAPTTYSI